jgi:hypothetical protein
MASISSRKSGCARADTKRPEMAGGFGRFAHTFWKTAKPFLRSWPWTTKRIPLDHMDIAPRSPIPILSPRGFWDLLRNPTEEPK